jgi:gas vesicle protein
MNKTLVTIIAGIAIGLLVAPRKGSETWNKLKDSFSDLKGEAQDKADDLLNESKKALRSGERELEQAIH